MKYGSVVGIAVGTEESNSGVSRQPCEPSAQQLMFIRAVPNGKTQKLAYRDAYPADRSTKGNICTTANRLLHYPKIEAFVQGINSTAAELLADDRNETRRFVFRELFALSKQAKQERYQIKALELIGKSCGLFEPKVEDTVENPSNATLKYALTERMRLINKM